MQNPIAKVIVLLVSLSIASSCFAADSPTAIELLQNLAALKPNLMRLITAASFIMGFAFFVKGIYQLKQYGELRTMMSSSTSLMAPLATLIAGAFLLYLPTGFGAFTLTVFGTNSPLQYSGGTTEERDLMIKVVIDIMYVVGVIAFIRGILLLQRAAQQGAQPGTFGKALTHIFGGVFAVNVYAFWRAFATTVGFS